MKAQTHRFSLLSLALLGLVVLALVLLVLSGTLPGRAALPDAPQAISNQQKAAILGAQNLLLLNPVPSLIYIPNLRK